MDSKCLEFPITIYGQAEKYNDVLTRKRCRIFYKYGNRNGTYITDEFADELISTLPYAPIKGIYVEDDADYSDHGAARRMGRIYGITPVDNHFAWEMHVDADGVERLYACTDVLLFSGLYPEETSIIGGKSQSMELYAPSLQYHYEIKNGTRYVVFDHGSFLGLQVLGDKVEPCFEGAAFYSLVQDSIDKIQLHNVGGISEMHIVNFKLSDNQKFEYLWSLLNPECDEAHDWAATYAITDVYDKYAVAYNYETQRFERIYYTKDDATDSLKIDKKEPVFIMDITESEKATVDALRALNGDTYELVNENLTNAEVNAQNCIDLNTKIEERDNSISTLNAEIETLKADFEKANADKDTLSQECEALKAYKLAAERKVKESVIEEYTDALTDEVLDSYKNKIDEYTAEDLDMRLAYELKKTGKNLFSQNNSGYVPKDTPMTGIDAILSRYVKGGR